jgi:hypothetical protein
MTLCAASLSLVLAAAPPGERRLNLEPIVLASSGAIAVLFSVWRFVVAETVYQELKGVPTMATSQVEASMILARARSLAFTGNTETALAGVLSVLGGALIVTGIVWLLAEGHETTEWLTVRF